MKWLALRRDNSNNFLRFEIRSDSVAGDWPRGANGQVDPPVLGSVPVVKLTRNALCADVTAAEPHTASEPTRPSKTRNIFSGVLIWVGGSVPRPREEILTVPG